ncbi:homeobox-leucine zipper protein HOX8-like [Oryza brachyantha]|uniref:homeobox-leucine zipper protein HOX8-like n=1 Tax=Oryza brachyantha TaxID=4533 RepID=UPI001ADB53E1|nr:homeobox-leucine zipper protein HOX8-like [Oryza brachyantha]
MKRPTCRGSSMAILQDTSDQQDQEDMRYTAERQDHRVDAAAAAYEEEEEEEDDDEEVGRGGGGSGGLGEKKRRLAAEQVRALERSFEADNKLDPERKARIARDLRLHPRQVAVWFQNRRARWKTKQIERDFAALRSRHDALRLECDSLRRDKDALAAEIMELREKVDKQMSVKLETGDEQPTLASVAATAAAAAAAAAATAGPAAVYNTKDGSTDSDSSAVFNEEASPYSGAAIDHHHHNPNPNPASYTAAGFTSFFAAPSSTLTSSLSFPPMFHASHFDQELLAGAGAAADAADLGATAGFFAAGEEHGGGLSWYGAEGW